jgi:hypothetical protein
VLSRKLTVEGDLSRIVFLKVSVHETVKEHRSLWLPISPLFLPKPLKISGAHFIFIIDVSLSYFLGNQFLGAFGKLRKTIVNFIMPI